MNYYHVVKETILYVENHLKDTITLEDLSKNTGYSKYHFSRIFKSQTGIPVMEFVCKRRLVHAIAEMNDGRDLVDIALDYGFETQGGFIKAFRKVYGNTPGRYRVKVLSNVSKSIRLLSIEKKEEEKEMKISVIENDAILQKVMNIADKMFNITARGSGKYGYDFWKRQFNETPELMIYAEDLGKVCGLAYGWVDNSSITIAYVGVEKEYQRQGIGHGLLTELENRAKALGYNRLTLGASAGEEGFYEKCGYTGCLLIQSEENTIAELRSINPGYEEIGSGIYDGNVKQLYLNIPLVNRELQKKYEKVFPMCNTIIVFGKTV